MSQSGWKPGVQQSRLFSVECGVSTPLFFLLYKKSGVETHGLEDNVQAA
jgi:hypothetical protein